MWRIRPNDQSRHVFARSGEVLLESPVERGSTCRTASGRSASRRSAAGLRNRAWCSMLAATAFCLLLSLAVFLLLRQPRILQAEVARRTAELRQRSAVSRPVRRESRANAGYKPGGTRLLDANNAFLTSYGYSREELRAMSLADLHPGRTLATGGLFFPARSSRDAQERRVASPEEEREVIDVEATSLDVSYDGEAARLALALDITNRKHAEDALKVQNNWLKSVLAHFPGGVTVAEGTCASLSGTSSSASCSTSRSRCSPANPGRSWISCASMRAAASTAMSTSSPYMAEAAKRINLLEPHHFERVRPDGTVLEVRGTPCLMAAVTSYTDITGAQAERGATACRQPAL